MISRVNKTALCLCYVLYICTVFKLNAINPNLSNNRCIKVKTLALQPQTETQTMVNSNFISILRSELETLNSLPSFPGSMLEKDIYCSKIPDLLKYGNQFPIEHGSEPQ